MKSITDATIIADGTNFTYQASIMAVAKRNNGDENPRPNLTQSDFKAERTYITRWYWRHSVFNSANSSQYDTPLTSKPRTQHELQGVRKLRRVFL